jgi:hypothetical protein
MATLICNIYILYIPRQLAHRNSAIGCQVDRKPDPLDVSTGSNPIPRCDSGTGVCPLRPLHPGRAVLTLPPPRTRVLGPVVPSAPTSPRHRSLRSLHTPPPHTTVRALQTTMVRLSCCNKEGMKKGPWTPEEDLVLVSHIQKHGLGNWRAVPTQIGTRRHLRESEAMHTLA